METPVWDFLDDYAKKNTVRLHMPGHKGRPFLGCEALDITEIPGADELYGAAGIIAESERAAASLYGARRTFYSTEGSSQCIRAMLYLALTARAAAPVIAAARNAHKAFLYAAALLDFSVEWLWPEGESYSLCSCPLSPDGLARALDKLGIVPAAVYVTSPDYLGAIADISGLAEVCHRRGTLLVVDNAHGAYLRFLRPSRHPLDLGADLCCDSAHKTLPVLTGGAYLHVGKCAPEALEERGKEALALFGSTSPSYLTLAALDRCNRYLAEEYPRRLAETAARLDRLREELVRRGWHLLPSDPLRLTVDAAASGWTGAALGELLRRQGVECEYAGAEALVLMATPENGEEDFARVLAALGENRRRGEPAPPVPVLQGERVCSIREALFAPHERIPAERALGRICGMPAVSCPPAIPIAVSGERIGPEALPLFARYGIETVDVLKGEVHGD